MSRVVRAAIGLAHLLTAARVIMASLLANGRRPARVLFVALFAVAVGAMPGAASELRRSAIVKAVEAAKPSVVNIRGEKLVTASDERTPGVEVDRRVNGMGTGVIIDDRGYILTNSHVVEGVARIEVTLASGTMSIAQLIASDPRTDLAVIKIEASRPATVIDIGTSSDLMIGETVIAVGNAYGYENTVTVGIVSAVHRSVEVGEGQTYEDLIQTDASINPGNSGGPLLNIDGEMIGLNVAVRAGAQGIGFAIPADKAMAIAADLLSARRVARTWHGVVPKKNVAGKDPGLVVAGLEEQSPAAGTELRVGDVIRGADGRTVGRPLDFERALLDHKAGEAVELTVDRNGQSVRVSMRLGALPTEPPRVEGDEIWQELGLKLKPVPAATFRQYNTEYHGGLSVVAVRPGSPAARQGIHRGDVLVGMHVYETVTADNVLWVMHRDDFRDLQPLKFYILREGQTLFGYMSFDETPGVARATR